MRRQSHSAIVERPGYCSAHTIQERRVGARDLLFSLQFPSPRSSDKERLLLGEETYCCEVLGILFLGYSLEGLKRMSYLVNTLLMPIRDGHYDQL
jgi:hypothetical protein